MTAISATGGGSLRWAVADTLVLTGRCLRHWVRQPQLLVLSTIQPVMLVLLFTQVFGGSVDTPGLRYVDYLVPGVIVQVVAWDSAQTAVALAADVASTTIDRFRTLPMAQAAPLAGRTLADAVRSLVVVLIMLGVGHTVGFRVHGGVGGMVAAVALVVAFGYALTWLFAYVGLTAGGAESAMAAGVVVVFPLMFASSALVPTQTLPEWLRPIAQHQPLTQVIDAARALLHGQPPGTALLGAMAWTVGLLAVSVPLALRRYFRR
jgi:ABC transporter DrrB family efflux protein